MREEEVYKILENTKSLKHKAILYLLYFGGFRVEEGVCLRKEDINPQRMLVHIECETLAYIKLKEINEMPYTEISNANLYYEEIGIGEPIIFLHSAFSRGIIAFSAQITALQSRYRCILPDLRGHGRTKSKDLDWTIPQLADDIVEFIDKLNIAKVNLVGFSMGGGVALYFATKYSNRVKSLVTIGTASCVTDGIKSNADNCEYHILKNEEDINYIELLKKNHYEAHMGDWKSFVKTSINNWRIYPNLTIEELRKIQAPSMFISGEKDNSINKEHLLELCKGVINSKIRVIEDCGHGPHFIGEKPELLNEILLQFLDENR